MVPCVGRRGLETGMARADTERTLGFRPISVPTLVYSQPLKWLSLHRPFRHLGYWFAVTEPLPFRVSDCTRQPFAVIYFARIPAEIKLRDVSMQVFSAHVVESSVDTALEQRER